MKRCKTAPVESPQQRKLEEYLSWQKEQQLKRCRLERYLRSVKYNDEPDEPKAISNYSGNFFSRKFGLSFFKFFVTFSFKFNSNKYFFQTF